MSRAKIERSRIHTIAASPQQTNRIQPLNAQDLMPRRFTIGFDDDAFIEVGIPGPEKKRSMSVFERARNSLSRARNRLSRFSIKPVRERLASYAGRIAKPANIRLRWNLLFTFLIFFFLTSSIWISAIPAVQNFAMEIVIIVLIMFHFLWFIGAINAGRYLWKMFDYRNQQFKRECLNGPDQGAIRYIEDNGKAGKVGKKALKHLVGLTIYKEPLQLMIDTVESLARQPNARGKITVVVGMEEGTPSKEEKTKYLMDMFASQFDRFYVAVHPKGLPGDIPGKCSNMNYAARKTLKSLREDQSYGLYEEEVELLVTTGDCDSIFGEHYFEALEEDYCKLTAEERHHTVWQSPLFYCINLDKSPFFVRVTGLMRAFFMMAYLIPWNINTMSIFTLTLQLYEEGDYTHPGYQMDDIIALIRWTLVVKRKCTIRAIPVATLSGPTSGANLWEEFKEWARQIRRWTIGAAEVFHYFVIKAGRLPLSVSIPWGMRFVFYYGFMLCISPIYGLVSPFLVSIMLNAQHRPLKGLVFPNYTVYNYVLLGMLGLSYFWFLIVFGVNKVAERVFPNGKKDETGWLRSFFHWTMSFPTIVGYCLVELYAFLEITVRGKEVCKHGASKKDSLAVIMNSDV